MLTRQFTTILYITLVVLALFGLFWVFSNILIYFIIALVLSTLLQPVTDYLSNIYFLQMRVPRTVSVLVSFALLVSIISFFVILFIPLVSEQVRILSSLDLELVLGRLDRFIAPLENFLINVVRVNKDPGFLSFSLRDSIYSLFDEIDLSSIINFTLQFSATFFISVLAVVFITFFLLYEKGILRRTIIRVIPNRYFELTITTLHKIEKLLSNYLLGLFLQIFFIFTLTSTGLTIVGVNYALTIGVFAALANVVPYIGPIIGAAFAAVIGVSTTPLLPLPNAAFLLMVKILLIWASVQLIDNLLLQPLIFSKSVKAHPLEIFVAIFAGAALAGPWGMIIAIPVYTVIRVSVIELRQGSKQYRIFQHK